MKIIFLGAPGAGKGTQAEIVSERLGIPTILGPHAFKHLFEWVCEGAYKGTIYESISMSEGVTYAQYLASSTASSLTSVFTFGGTTLLIVVGVAVETFREIEAQLTMRNYKGFL